MGTGQVIDEYGTVGIDLHTVPLVVIGEAIAPGIKTGYIVVIVGHAVLRIQVESAVVTSGFEVHEEVSSKGTCPMKVEHVSRCYLGPGGRHGIVP